MCEALDIERDRAHRALDDALACRTVARRLTDQAIMADSYKASSERRGSLIQTLWAVIDKMRREAA